MPCVHRPCTRMRYLTFTLFLGVDPLAWRLMVRTFYAPFWAFKMASICSRSACRSSTTSA